MKIRLATDTLQRDSIVDGEGIRTVIWTQGCPHNCPGCHNPETHSVKNGILVDIEDIKKKLVLLEGQNGLTFSGGDPMLQAKECNEIAKFAKAIGLNIWCYTGYTFEELLKLSKVKKEIAEFLKNIDVLIDGKFILSQKSYDVTFRGSKNQRIIDVNKSLLYNETVIITKYDYSNINTKGRKSKYVFV